MGYSFSVFIQHFGDFIPQCGSWPWGWCLGHPTDLVPVPSCRRQRVSETTGCLIYVLTPGNLAGSFLEVWWVSFLWWLECSRPSMTEVDFHPRQKLSAGVSAALAKYHPQEKLLRCNCDAHKRFCFCFVAIAVTAILCESKLWLWPEMTPVGDGCRKKEAVSVELASARSRTRRAMEEVDF